MTELQTYIHQQSDQWINSVGLKGSAISNLSDYTHIVSRIFRGRSWLFRGEGKLYKQPASPSIFRNNFQPSSALSLDRTITDQEISEVEGCQKNHPDGSDRYIRAFMPLIHTHDVNWLPLARHFGYHTRLLDVTLNPLVALYFGCMDQDNTHDAYIYAMQSGGFRPINDRNLVQRNQNDFPPIPISYLDLYDVDVNFVDKKWDDLPYLFEPTIPQERLQAQAGRFLFWRDVSLILPKERQLIPIRIEGKKKAELLSELTAFGIIHETLFPNNST